MSLIVIRPCSSFSSSTMQRVSISTSRIRFHAARTLISPSIPACLRMSMSLICGLTSVQRRGASMPKCCRTNRVSRFTCPARRASYRPLRLPRFFSHAYASAEQIESVSGFWWPMILMWRVVFAIGVFLSYCPSYPQAVRRGVALLRPRAHMECAPTSVFLDSLPIILIIIAHIFAFCDS